MKISGVLETVLYAEDLKAARQFYEEVLGLECFAEDEGRDVFFYCGDQVLLIFNPHRTSIKRPQGPGIPPPHGAFGQGHLCFQASDEEITQWRQYLEERGIAIEADFVWKTGGRSLYFRDPAGNSIEFAEPKIWRLPREKRSLRGQKLLIATHNRGKLKEFAAILAPYGVNAVSAGDLGISEPEETEATFRGNARIKAEHAMKASGLISLADDSGLCVDALDGAPGVYTANWAGPNRDWPMAMRLVEEKLQAAGARSPEQRQAAFNCTLCVVWPDGEERFYEGQAPGHLVWPPRGQQGHGYDPVFVPEGETQTFGEMDPARKNQISHRARALEKFFRDLF